jgi:hypothetical protein
MIEDWNNVQNKKKAKFSSTQYSSIPEIVGWVERSETQHKGWIPAFACLCRHGRQALVKSRKTDFLPQHISIMQDDDAICCGQNKMLGLFTRPSGLSLIKKYYLC